MTDGVYNQQAKTQEKAMKLALQLLRQAASRIPLETGNVVQVGG